ncbi:MAG: bifunctional diaminohydroxyphosphoribosylaminopyrimidine deaminase/5-amino-6-(5-phosphoribosylamino)uracil reductase RibD [Desulfobacterales bacterium]|jgi:diaminohydroxyphosphoribosylaminopyrimidine deaminase / 5-amino-6-(5-phosphoribosylamino)uracil reductase|nr:bifunctional diaminohydroxyphosphoribosylaminopyrimidine deaminase/5-amino-6-(5-phosphoribosylamino)uracil reductase RibD [Desulfobacteraceae bacterium]MBT4363569.1 bifunctional diaminohydroxyphosphoribosylaminopyrimidine deaminase/5-amino-6-(5-phosphoribosylamino)uracil reductase RibD [Desulfobacteraceae bacterium]MBT7086850.1 bifunctional diaminohydroxyphosphoribosylaminopyrimidine deaminase/5-amino-6-(5-phosphoribosylamino)uracil reductase RibD [Desulfobacterales bacterium]MBT7695962.1 bif
MNDVYFMKTALAYAERGRGYTSPNPMVGAVVVKNHKIVGTGWHRNAGGPHAEVNAINDAGDQVKGSTIYVTLEPCNHTGRTPPCTEKIIDSGIRHVVVAMEDPNPDVKGGGIKRLKEHGITVTSGICEDEAKKLNEIFVKYIRTKKPFVVLKCASTLDGRIATRTGDSKWITGVESRRYAHEIRHLVDGIMVGIDTVKQDNPSLTTRLDGKEGLDPARIILDTRLSIHEDAGILHLDSKSETLIITGLNISNDKKALIERNGIKVIKVPEKEGRIDLKALMDILGDMGITSLLIEGGSRVINSALSAGIVDKIFFFYAPKILGGDNGVPVCRGEGPDLMSESIQVKDIEVKRFGEDVLIEGYL